MKHEPNQITGCVAYGQLVSVVVPVYNRAHLVARTVGSVCTQSYRNLDIVVVDDCSTDDIEAAAAGLCDPRVRLVRRAKNGGVAAARNTGIAEARGEVIAFHDSDDYCTPDRIELSMRLLASLPADYIGVYGMRLFYTEPDDGQFGAMQVSFRPLPSEKVLSGDLSARTSVGADNGEQHPELPDVAGDEGGAACRRPIGRVSAQERRLGPVTTADPTGQVRLRAEAAAIDAELTGPIGQRAACVPFDPPRRTQLRADHRQTGPSWLCGATVSSPLRHHRELSDADRRPRAARRFYRSALAITPGRPKLWASYILSSATGLQARFRRPAKV